MNAPHNAAIIHDTMALHTLAQWQLGAERTNTSATLYYRYSPNQDFDQARDDMIRRISRALHGANGISSPYEPVMCGKTPAIKIELKEAAFLQYLTLEREYDKQDDHVKTTALKDIARNWAKEAICTLYYNPEGLPKGLFIDGKGGVEFGDVRFGEKEATFRVIAQRPLEQGSAEEELFQRTLRYAVYGMGRDIREADVQFTPVVYANDSAGYDMHIRGCALASLKEALRKGPAQAL